MASMEICPNMIVDTRTLAPNEIKNLLEEFNLSTTLDILELINHAVPQTGLAELKESDPPDMVELRTFGKPSDCGYETGSGDSTEGASVSSPSATKSNNEFAAFQDDLYYVFDGSTSSQTCSYDTSESLYEKCLVDPNLEKFFKDAIDTRDSHRSEFEDIVGKAEKLQQLNSSQSSGMQAVVVENVAKKKLLYQCDICQWYCSRKTNLIAHVNALHIGKDERYFKCETCLKVWPSFKQLQQHEQSHRQEQNCKKCFKVIEKTMSVRKHDELFHPGPKSYKCEYCEDNFLKFSYRNRHVKEVHKVLASSKKDKTSKTVDKMPFKICPVPTCGIFLSVNTLLRRHLLTHNIGQADIFTCQFCTKTFIQKNNCKRHELLVHANKAGYRKVRGVKSACETTTKECVAAPAAYESSKIGNSVAQHNRTSIKDLLENFCSCDNGMCSYITRPSTSVDSPSQALSSQRSQRLEKNLTVMKENVILANNNMVMQTNLNEVAEKRNEVGKENNGIAGDFRQLENIKVTHGKKNPAEEKNNVTVEKSGTAENKNVTTKRKNPTEVKNNMTVKTSRKAKNENVTKEKSNGTAEKKNPTEEKKNVTTEKSRTAENKNVTAEKRNGIAEKKNLTVEQRNVTAEKKNMTEKNKNESMKKSLQLAPAKYSSSLSKSQPVVTDIPSDVAIKCQVLSCEVSSETSSCDELTAVKPCKTATRDDLTFRNQATCLTKHSGVNQRPINAQCRKMYWPLKTLQPQAKRETSCSSAIAATNTFAEIAEKPLSTMLLPVLPRHLMDCRVVLERLVFPVSSCEVSSKPSSFDELTAVKRCKTTTRDDHALRNQAACLTKHSGVTRSTPSVLCRKTCLPEEALPLRPQCVTSCSRAIVATNTLAEIPEKPSAVLKKLSTIIPRRLMDCRVVLERLVFPVLSCEVLSGTSSFDELTAVKPCKTTIRNDITLHNQAVCLTKHSGVNQHTISPCRKTCLPLKALPPRPKYVISCSSVIAATNKIAEIAEKPPAVSTKLSPVIPQLFMVCIVVLERLVISAFASNDSKSTSLSGIDTAMFSFKKCDICSKIYTTVETLRRHVKLVHSELQKFKCDACEISFCVLRHLVRHKASVHKDVGSLSKCELCPKKFLLKSNLKQHLKYHSNEKLYKCDACNVAFSDARYLAAHVRDHGSHVCEVCDKKFTRARVLKCHMRLHTKETEPHQCNDCGKTFNFINRLHSHYKLHHPNSIAMKPTPCVPCGKKFGSYLGYSKHVKTRHHEDNMRGYECNKCRLRFSRKSSIAKHLKTDCSPKLHVCLTCGKSFSYLGYLKRHLNNHKLLCAFRCVPCDKIYRSKSSLQAHRLAKRHCSVCNPIVSFRWIEDLDEHAKSHEQRVDIQPREVIFTQN